MSGFKKLKVKIEVRDYIVEEDLTGIYIPPSLSGYPKEGGKIVRDPSAYTNQFYISKEDFERVYLVK